MAWVIATAELLPMERLPELKMRVAALVPKAVAEVRRKVPPSRRAPVVRVLATVRVSVSAPSLFKT